MYTKGDFTFYYHQYKYRIYLLKENIHRISGYRQDNQPNENPFGCHWGIRTYLQVFCYFPHK
jgi:hypothetical protein